MTLVAELPGPEVEQRHRLLGGDERVCQGPPVRVGDGDSGDQGAVQLGAEQLTGGDRHVIQSLVAAGMGVTLLPDLALVAPNPGVRVIKVLPEPPVRRVWAATLMAGSRSRATEAMLDVLEQVSAEFAPKPPAVPA